MREDTGYVHWQDVPTRWKDNDIYGHVNNAAYYSFMDTAVNTWLIESSGLDIHNGTSIGLCVESHCPYKAPAAFPETIAVGLRVDHLGRSSVRYELGLYRDDDLLAEGHFVHVFVDRETPRPQEITAPLRPALESLPIRE